MADKLKMSKIDNNVRFALKQFSIQDVFMLRKENLKTTSLFWITLSIKYDPVLKEIYNPKAMILLFLN